MKQFFYFFLVLGSITLNAQEYYHNEIYNQNLSGEICSDIIIGDESYFTFSVTYIYDVNNINQGEMIVLREFDYSGELLKADSLAVNGCSIYPHLADNVIRANDGGFIVAWHDCNAHLIKFNSNLEFEWEQQYEHVFGLHSIAKHKNGYLITGGVKNQLGEDDDDEDIWYAFVDSLGNINSEFIYGDEIKNDRILFTEATNDGGYILSGGRYHNWNPLIVKIDSVGNVEWEQTFGNNYQHGHGIAYPINDSTYLFAYAKALDDDLFYPLRKLKLVLLNSNGGLTEELYSSEFKNDFIVYDLEIAGDDIYILFHQHSEAVSDPTGFRESGVLKYNLTTGLEWERIYHGNLSNQDRFTLYDLELIDTPENEIGILMAGDLFDYTTIGSLLQCTWVLGADCQGYPVYPELNISSELIDEGSPGGVLFENIGTQVNDLNWWFSNGDMSSEISPQINFDNNGAYAIELTAPYCGETISAIDTFYVEGIGIEELLSTRKTLVRTIDVLGREISRDYTGQVIDVFDDGTVRKRFKYE